MSVTDTESILFIEPTANNKLVFSIFTVIFLFMLWIEFAPFEDRMAWELIIVFVFVLMGIGGLWWLLVEGGECGRKLIVDKKGIQLDTYYKGVLQPQSSYKISWSNVSLIQSGHSAQMSSDKIDLLERHIGVSGHVIHIHTNEKVRLLVANEWEAESSQSLAFLGIDDKQKRTEVLRDVISAFAKRAQIQVN